MLKISIKKYLDIFNQLNIENIIRFRKVYLNLYKNAVFKKFLLDSPFHLYYYCLHIENQRCKEMEYCFLSSSNICLNYSVYVLKDRLPDELHNFMICKFFEEDEAAKCYFSYLKKMKNANYNFGPWGDYK